MKLIAFPAVSRGVHRYRLLRAKAMQVVRPAGLEAAAAEACVAIRLNADPMQYRAENLLLQIGKRADFKGLRSD